MKKFILISLIFFLGIGARFFFANLNLYNFDIMQFYKDVDIYRNHGNIYIEQNKHYNYSPLWYYYLGILDKVTLQEKYFPLYLTIRISLIIVDIFNTLILIWIAYRYKKSLSLTAGLYMLNPILIVLTGYHGQFEQLAMFFLLAAFALSISIKNKIHKALLFACLVISFCIKHVIAFPLILFIQALYNSRIKTILLTSIITIIFLTTFIPYIKTASKEIVSYVFMYRSVERRYGIPDILNRRCQTCVITNVKIFNKDLEISAYSLYFVLFIVGFILSFYFLKFTDPGKAILFGALYFVTWTNGIGAQYLFLPMIIGTLYPSKWMLIAIVLQTGFVLGNSDELGQYAFDGFGWTIVWVANLFWFFHEFFKNSPRATKLYNEYSNRIVNTLQTY